jgi:hypothetical protein
MIAGAVLLPNGCAPHRGNGLRPAHARRAWRAQATRRRDAAHARPRQGPRRRAQAKLHRLRRFVLLHRYVRFNKRQSHQETAHLVLQSPGNGAAELLTKLLSHIVSNKQDEKGAPSPANRQQSARPSLMSRAKSTFRRRNTVGSDAATTPTTRHSLSSSSSSSASSSPATERAAPQQGTFRRALTATLRGLRPGRGRATLEEAGTVPPPVEAETVLPPVEAAQPPAPLEADAPLNDAAAADEEPQPQPPAPEESHE